MKKLTAISTLFALATSVFATDLTLNISEIPTDTTWSWGDANMWLPADSTVEGGNLKFTGTLASKTTSYNDTALTFGDVVFSLSNSSSTAFILDKDSAKITMNSLTFDSTENSSYYKFGLENSKPTDGIVVENDIVAKTANGNTQYVYFAVSGTGKQLTVKGNIYITNNKATDNFMVSGEIRCSGILYMKAADNADGAKMHLQMWSQAFAGVDDCGIEANHVLKSEWGGTFSLNVTEDCKWHGELEGRAINMKMTNASTATQRMEITSGSFYGITVSGGRFELETASTNTNGALTINGGEFLHESDVYVDSVKLTNGAICYNDNSGTIIAQKVLNEDGSVKVDGSLSKGTEQFIYDFEGLTKAGVYDLISFAVAGEGITYDANNDFVAINLKEGLTADFVYNGNTLQAIVVPEPATVATIFGAIALALAVYRRRK